jgi:hypothetical protein
MAAWLTRALATMARMLVLFVAVLGDQPFGRFHDPLAGNFGWSIHCLYFQTTV